MEKFNPEEFKRRLREVVKKLGISNKDFGLAGSVDPKTIKNVFFGSSSPKPKHLHGWAEKLNLNLNWLLLGVGPMFREDTLEQETPEGAIATKPFIDRRGNIESKPIGPIALAVAEMEASQHRLDPDATEADVIDNVIHTLSLRRRKLGPKQYPTAREKSSTHIAQEDRTPYTTGNACGIDGDPANEMVQLMGTGDGPIKSRESQDRKRK